MREWLLAEAHKRSTTMEPAESPSPEVAETVDVRGIRTNYHDVGSGPPVVLIHGSGPGVSAWANWRLTLPYLSERFRVLAPDVLGFGYTERPQSVPYDLDTWTNHLLDFLDALGLERVSIVGNSFGGALALSIATRAPERVDKLVLMGSVGVPFELTPGLDAVWGFEPSLSAMRALLDVFAYDRSLVSDDLARLRLDASTRPGVQEAFRSMFPAPRQASVEAMTIDEDLVRGLPHETLVLHGRDDLVIPMTNSLRLLELIENAQLHVFGRCGHWVQIEHTDEFNRLVTDFLSPHDVA
jgi:2-hydroxymuconate-semialdehyde hydrolase